MSYKSALSDVFVHVIHRNITELPVDAIVNAANENLMHGGGVAAAIAEAAGHDLVRDCDEYMANVRRSMPIPVGDNYISVAGRLPCTYVIHAVGPMRADYAEEDACARDVQKTVFNCLRDASQRRLKSIALPAISSGNHPTLEV
jgi:O-acetyl-ADP-ribose deacetylase (regulator of RNase III)